MTGWEAKQSDSDSFKIWLLSWGRWQMEVFRIDESMMDAMLVDLYFNMLPSDNEFLLINTESNDGREIVAMVSSNRQTVKMDASGGP